MRVEFRAILAASALHALLLATPSGAQAHLVLPAPDGVRTALHLDGGTLQMLAPPPERREPFRTRVLLGTDIHTLDVSPFRVRSEGFRLLAEDGVGGLHEQPLPPETTYRGTVVGVPGSFVALTAFEGTLTALVRVADEVWTIQPATDVLPGLPRACHVVSRDAELRPPPLRCAGAQRVPASVPSSSSARAAGTGGNRVEIALEVNSDFCGLFGSTAAAVASAEATINGMAAIYLSDLGLQYRIKRVVICSNPYGSGCAVSLMAARWNALAGGVPRDVAHLFLGNPGAYAGIAFIGTVCCLNYAYGVSWYNSSYTVRVAIAAHEVGHNWNAPHCDGAPDCRIMCSAIGGCSGTITSFGAGSIGAISSFQSGLTCLD